MPAKPGALSPYSGVPENDWLAVTRNLLKNHPLTNDLVATTLEAWKDVFATRIGVRGYRIGTDIELSPQIMSSFLHELIPLILKDSHPGEWCRERTKNEKDLVCLSDIALSVEIKASSHPSQIFGNRSFAQPSSATDLGRKGKSGYYLTINFEKFLKGKLPKIVQIRFGWLDHSDWIPQASPTGQQARVDPRAYRSKLIRLYPAG